jgi:beta-fructofuranosidase
MILTNLIKTIHYKPANGFVGDPLPFWHDGIWHVFFVKLKVDNNIVLSHVATKDFINWQEYPDALDNGQKGSLDEFLCGTGSIVENDNLFHLFYTGGGRNGYNILKATSSDLILWEKEYKVLVNGGVEWYRQDGLWRDPCVFWNPEEDNWWMVFCARIPAGTDNFMPGAVGLAKSSNLKSWCLYPPAWAESLGGWIECPNIFRHEGKWVLNYYWRDTVFRFSNSPSGPWRRANVVTPSGFAFSAGKTATDGHRCIVFGWIPRKESDCSMKVWGGELAIPREFYILKDGTPAVRCPQEIANAFSQDITEGRGATVFTTIFGQCQVEKNQLKIKSEDKGTLLLWKDCPADFCLEFSLCFKEKRGVLSFFIRSEHEIFAWDSYVTPVDVGYELLFDTFSGHICLREHYEYNQKPDIATLLYDFSAEDETACRIILHSCFLEIFIGNQCSMVTRLLKHPQGALGLASSDGTIILKDFYIRTIE